MRPVRLVLDTTAALSYTRGTPAVGETIREVVDEGAGYAIPVVCLAEAAAPVGPDRLRLLELLVAHSHAVVVPPSADWVALGVAVRVFGSVSRAAALVAAVKYRAYLLSGESDAYGDVDIVIGV